MCFFSNIEMTFLNFWLTLSLEPECWRGGRLASTALALVPMAAGLGNFHGRPGPRTLRAGRLRHFWIRASGWLISPKTISPPLDAFFIKFNFSIEYFKGRYDVITHHKNSLFSSYSSLFVALQCVKCIVFSWKHLHHKASWCHRKIIE